MPITFSFGDGERPVSAAIAAQRIRASAGSRKRMESRPSFSREQVEDRIRRAWLQTELDQLLQKREFLYSEIERINDDIRFQNKQRKQNLAACVAQAPAPTPIMYISCNAAKAAKNAINRLQKQRTGIKNELARVQARIDYLIAVLG